MDLADFAFTPLPQIGSPRALAAASPLELLQELTGTWKGTGFNVIWRPNSVPGQDRFLELNLTEETLQFEEIPGAIPNRGLLQHDIDMFGLWYLQKIEDQIVKATGQPAGLHIEPGIWATVSVNAASQCRANRCSHGIHTTRNNGHRTGHSNFDSNGA